MPLSDITYADWKAPAEDGQTLVWPEPVDLLAHTAENHQHLSGAQDVAIQNVPLPELRHRARTWLGHDRDQLLLATGHQTELYHAGVWAKTALISAAAERIGGQAYHFAVDTDAPKHLHLRWPGGGEPITDDPALSTAAWSGLLDPPTPRHVHDVTDALNEASRDWSFTPAAHEFLASLRRLTLDAGNLSNVITNATHQLDWSLGLRHHALICSPMWWSDAYLVFVHHLISRADGFARSYNAALADYRRAHRIRTSARPMPDLVGSADRVEVPFWLDDLSRGTRGRATVQRVDGTWTLRRGPEDEFRFESGADGWTTATQLARWLRQRDLRLSPRALTLTMFLRLCVVDQFVHGIGGGRYDQVTDKVIDDHFGLRPPAFAVTTATLYFPAAVGRSRTCVPCLLHEGHQLRHRVLGERKRDFVRQIDAAPRRSLQRRRLFFDMRREISTVAAGHPMLQRWQQRLHDAERRIGEELPLFDRELFYAIQPTDRLRALVERYQSMM